MTHKIALQLQPLPQHRLHLPFRTITGTPQPHLILNAPLTTTNLPHGRPFRPVCFQPCACASSSKCGSTTPFSDAVDSAGTFGNRSPARLPILAPPWPNAPFLIELSLQVPPRNQALAKSEMVRSSEADHWQCSFRCSLILVEWPRSGLPPRRTSPRSSASTDVTKASCSPTNSLRQSWNNCECNSSRPQTP